MLGRGPRFACPGARDRAIILMLLDTGLRASELCSLKAGDVDMHTGKAEVKHSVQGGAKGGKGRMVFLGKSVKRVIWGYLASREDGTAMTFRWRRGSFLWRMSRLPCGPTARTAQPAGTGRHPTH